MWACMSEWNEKTTASELHKWSIRLADILDDTREINFNKCKCYVWQRRAKTHKCDMLWAIASAVYVSLYAVFIIYMYR